MYGDMKKCINFGNYLRILMIFGTRVWGPDLKYKVKFIGQYFSSKLFIIFIYFFKDLHYKNKFLRNIAIDKAYFDTKNLDNLF